MNGQYSGGSTVYPEPEEAVAFSRLTDSERARVRAGIRRTERSSQMARSHEAKMSEVRALQTSIAHWEKQLAQGNAALNGIDSAFFRLRRPTRRQTEDWTARRRMQTDANWSIRTRLEGFVRRLDEVCAEIAEQLVAGVPIEERPYGLGMVRRVPTKEMGVLIPVPPERKEEEVVLKTPGMVSYPVGWAVPHSMSGK